jgi:hypothetical protein
MEVYKFRAWAKKTIDHYISDPIDISNKEFAAIEPKNRSSIEWDLWYQDRENRMQEIRNEMNPDADNRYEISYEMITNFSVKGDGTYTRPYGYEILEVMQYTGLNDEEENEIYNNDIVELTIFDIEGADTQCICKVETDQYGGVWFVDIKNDNNQWSLSNCNIVSDDLTLKGNIFNNSELLQTK